MKFSKEDLQKMVDEKIKEIELDIQAIRNEAIDDCIEALKERRDTRYMKVNCDDVELRLLAEQLKAGD